MWFRKQTKADPKIVPDDYSAECAAADDVYGLGESLRFRQEGDCPATRELKEFRQVGETFKYLGVTILVTGYSTTTYDEYHHKNFRPLPTWRPRLQGDYTNTLGEICSIDFGYEELPVLKAENSV